MTETTDNDDDDERRTTQDDERNTMYVQRNVPHSQQFEETSHRDKFPLLRQSRDKHISPYPGKKALYILHKVRLAAHHMPAR
jgi:hypothetical protein